MAVSVVTGCAAPVAGDKAGGDSVTLRLGVEHGPGMPASEQMEHFAEQVDQLSDGLRIELVWNAAGEVDDWDQAVAQMVIDGELDLGMIPARAWDSLGVTTLQALHAPFLVTSEALMDSVLRDDIVGDMLAGLDEVGVVGLALVPESLRHLFFYGEPVATAAQFEGLRVRVPRSETVYALFDALGAIPDDYANWNPPHNGQESEGPAAAESSFAWASQLPGTAALTAIGNLPLLPKINTLVAHRGQFGRLTETHREILMAAAHRTSTWALETRSTTAEAAKAFCGGGGRVVAAADDEVAAMQLAAGPVTSELERDATTRGMMVWIRARQAELGAGPTTVPPCGRDSGGPVDPAASSSATGTSVDAFPEGVYRAEVSQAFLEDAGIDSSTAVNHAGTWTLTFRAGQLAVEDVNGARGRTVDRGVYCVDGDRLRLGLLGRPPACGDFWTATWIVTGEKLRFVDVQSGHGSDRLIEVLFGGQPFTRIG